MNTPSSIRPGIYGALIGGIIAIAVGFGPGGWYLGSTAESMAVQRSKVAVIDALVPLCVGNQQVDPDSASKLAMLAAMKTTYEQRDFVMKAGWATLPPSELPNRELAVACADALAKSAQG